MKFKSNGTKAKRPLEQIQKTLGAKKKKHFFLFSLGVLHGFSLKSNKDGFSWKSNGGWTFLGINRGFAKRKHREQKKKSNFFCFSWGFYTDFLGNQMMMNFLGNRMVDGFPWESNRGFANRKLKEPKKKKKKTIIT